MKKFISVLKYHPTLFLLERESHYHFGPCFAMLEEGFEVEILALGDQPRIEDDPNYDPRIQIRYMHSNFEAMVYLWKNRDAIIYANTFIILSLLVGIIGKKTLFFSHDPVLPTKYSSFFHLKKQFVKFCYRFFTKIRVINDYEREWLLKEGLGDTGVVIPLVISEDNLTPPSPDQCDILLLGHIVPKKNIETIVNALKIVFDTYPNMKAHLVGNTNGFKNEYGFGLKEILSQMGIEKNVILYGAKRKSEILELHLPTGIYVNSSFMEGQCIAAYDASILGNALCLPNISSFFSVLDDKVLRHDVNDYEMLARNIIYYRNHPEIRREHVLENQKWIHNHHSFRVVQEKIKRAFTLKDND